MKVYFNPYKQFTGIWIPDWLLQSDICSIQAKITYAVLCKHSGENGHCYPSQQLIANQTGVSDRQVRNYIQELKECGLIEVVRSGLKKTNRYYFLEHPIIPDRKDSSGQDRKDSSGPIVREKEVREKGVKGSDAPAGATTIAGEVSDFLLNAICETDPSHRFNNCKPSLESWGIEIDRAIRIDGRKPEDLKRLIQIIFYDNNRVSQFWRANIQSGKKLREKFDTIKNQLKTQVSHVKHSEAERYIDSLYHN